ncbi:MAG: aminodeoxychorismate/anthranilate synthase component II [Gemmatimonadota bacterium]|nr:aminodeoxychorismate/anthranilate synthase component II [Gemmatimonadota bacterium]
MILLVDNYDSFVFNLARYFEELGESVCVVRNDEVTVADVRTLGPSHIVLSPGPCTPDEAGVSVPLIRELSGSTPVLGVCLGHQCISVAFGGGLARARRPMHGALSSISHDGKGLFAGLESPLQVTRYHSLVIPLDDPGGDVLVTARSESGEAMAVQHRALPVWGVQFHPEAVLTSGGHRLLANFVALGRGERSEDVRTDLSGRSEIRDPAARG